AVGRKRHAMYLALMALEPQKFLARGHIPKPSRVIAAGGKDRLAIRREGDGAYRCAVPDERASLLARGHVPEPNDAIAARRGQGAAVGTEGQAENAPVV